MPRHPKVAPTTASLSTRVFSGLAAKAQARKAAGLPLYPLHVGDTFREPPEQARVHHQTGEGIHTYGSVRGEAPLLEAISDRTEALGRRIPPSRLQVMSGATSGLSVVMSTILNPGDEVLLPSPYWPLIRGIIASRGGVPVEVPLFAELAAGNQDADAIETALEASITDKTVALYVNTPHNPTGAMLTDSAADAFVNVAKRHDLWLITDEAYQDLYFGEKPKPLWARDDVQDRYIACHTLSKSYGLAGARIGYTHGPQEFMTALTGVQTFATYCAAKPMQYAAAEALRHGARWLDEARSLYAKAGATAAQALGVHAPAGGTFLLFDATPYLREGEDTALPFMERCLDAGVMLTPGASCGKDFATWVRLCFTSVPQAQLEEALALLRPLLAP